MFLCPVVLRDVLFGTDAHLRQQPLSDQMLFLSLVYFDMRFIPLEHSRRLNSRAILAHYRQKQPCLLYVW